MQPLAWAVIGLVVGFLTRKLLGEAERAKLIRHAMAVAGAIAAGAVMYGWSTPEHAGFMYTSLAAVLGSASLAAITL